MPKQVIGHFVSFYRGVVGESKRGNHFVSFRFVRACWRARGLVAQCNAISRGGSHLFPFPFWLGELSVSLSSRPPNLLSSTNLA